MKRAKYIILSLLLLLLGACVNDCEIIAPEVDNVPEGYTKIEFGANISTPTVVDTRAVDPDGLDVNNMTLFCFNEFGLYISSEEAQIVPGSKTEDGISEHGKYTAVIPSNTHIIHFLANHSSGLYDEKDFLDRPRAWLWQTWRVVQVCLSIGRVSCSIAKAANLFTISWQSYPTR
jgi:hypothetical protein